jgi:hypothetical protein
MLGPGSNRQAGRKKQTNAALSPLHIPLLFPCSHSHLSNTPPRPIPRPLTLPPFPSPLSLPRHLLLLLQLPLLDSLSLPLPEYGGHDLSLWDAAPPPANPNPNPGGVINPGISPQALSQLHRALGRRLAQLSFRNVPLGREAGRVVGAMAGLTSLDVAGACEVPCWAGWVGFYGR